MSADVFISIGALIYKARKPAELKTFRTVAKLWQVDFSLTDSGLTVAYILVRNKCHEKL